MNMSKMARSGCKYLSDPKYRFQINRNLGLYDSWDDERFLRRAFLKFMGKPLNLDDPVTFNEKLQWLKLYDRKPEYTTLVDKYRVREVVSEKLGEEYMIPLLGVWDAPNDIDFNALPNQFVLKCNHNSGFGMCICKNKIELDIEKTKTALSKGLKQDYYLSNREWPYKDIPRKIIGEKFIACILNNGISVLNDYKIWCFNGEPKIILVCSDRYSQSGLCEDFFDMDWHHLPLKRADKPTSQKDIEKPKNYILMQQMAKELANNIPFVRVDFYEVDDKVYFGELTFYPMSGWGQFVPEEWDQKLGEWLQLP